VSNNEVEITLASTTETQDELDHAVSSNWREPFDPEKAKVQREEKEKAAAAEAVKTTGGSAPPEKPVVKVEGEGEPEGDEEPLPKGVQRRIDTLTKRSKTAEQENRSLRERLEALETKAGVKPAEKSGEPAPKADLEPLKKDFKDPDEWVKAHGKWAAREVAREAAVKAEQDAADSYTQEVFDAHLARTQGFRAEHPDFDEKVDASTTVFSESLAIAIVEAENGPAVTYYLAEHPEELEKISKLSKAKQMMEIGRLSASLSPSTESKDRTTTTQTRPRTPTPITPVRSTKTASSATNLSEMDTDTFIKRRDEQEREARRNRH
jgi:hypothetical protein